MNGSRLTSLSLRIPEQFPVPYRGEPGNRSEPFPGTSGNRSEPFGWWTSKGPLPFARPSPFKARKRTGQLRRVTR